MKNLNELILHFPEMDKKQQQSTLGGNNYDEGPGGGGTGGVVDGGSYDPGVVITAPYTPPYYPTPGFGNGNNNDGGGSSGSNGGNTTVPTGPGPSGITTVTPLHASLVSDLIGKFHYDLTPEEEAVFERTIAEVDTTKSGDKILTKLNDYYTANPSKIPTISDKLGFDKDGNRTMIEYNANTLELNLGPTPVDNQHFDTYNVYVLSHELYHAYEHSTGQNSMLANFEADAYLFASEVVKEGVVDYGQSVYMKGQESTADEFDGPQQNFNNAWESFINGDHSNGNYATLIDNFFAGSADGQKYQYNSAGQVRGIDPNAVPQFIKDLQ